MSAVSIAAQTNSTRLALLRANLAALRRRRQAVRLVTALAALAVAILGMLAAALVLDLALEADRTVRAGMLVAIGLGIVWAWLASVRPSLGRRETELDMALLVERQARASGNPVSRDLVAALQFESPHAAQWGSVELERVVIDDVAGQCRAIDVFQGFSLRQMTRRVAMLLAMLGLLTAAAMRYPDYAAAFFDRLLLGATHYPTATRIDKVLVNGRTVNLSPAALASGTAIPVPCAEGQPLVIEAFCSQALPSSALPSSGKAELATESGRRTTIELASPVLASSVAASSLAAEPLAGRGAATYSGRLERLSEPLTYQLYLGDAWTDPAQIKLIPLPVVECTLQPMPPDYARSAAAQPPDLAGVRTIEVLEGSSVAVWLESKNKPLRQIALVVGDRSLPLVQRDSERRGWYLNPQGTPLAEISQESRYRLDIVDDDGLAPDSPPEGVIRIRPDGHPRITATVKTRFVVPTGFPAVEYRLADDFGIAAVQVRASVVREGAAGRERIEHRPIPIPLGPTPLVGDRLPSKNTFVLPLAQLKLVKGDRLELALEAIDYRGSLAGKSSQTEPIVLQVTDAHGVESAVTELDPALEQQFQNLIQKQQDIGASK
jgi:hypothetical protein